MKGRGSSSADPLGSLLRDVKDRIRRLENNNPIPLGWTLRKDAQGRLLARDAGGEETVLAPREEVLVSSEGSGQGPAGRPGDTGPEGPPGPPGPPGEGGGGTGYEPFVQTFTVPSTAWVVNHNLNYLRVDVILTTIDGEQFMAGVSYTDLNNLTVHHSIPMSGVVTAHHP